MKKINHMSLIIEHNKNQFAINKRINYEDREWRKKNNVQAFLEITDVALLQQVNQESISLFDVMTKTSVLGIYSQFDWATIQESYAFYEIAHDRERGKFR